VGSQSSVEPELGVPSKARLQIDFEVAVLVQNAVLHWGNAHSVAPPLASKLGRAYPLV